MFRHTIWFSSFSVEAAPGRSACMVSGRLTGFTCALGLGAWHRAVLAAAVTQPLAPREVGGEALVLERHLSELVSD